MEAKPPFCVDVKCELKHSAEIFEIATSRFVLESEKVCGSSDIPSWVIIIRVSAEHRRVQLFSNFFVVFFPFFCTLL